MTKNSNTAASLSAVFPTNEAQPMTQAEMQAELARLRADNAKMKDDIAKRSTLKCKVSDKGGVSVYGINARFPVTLYGDQWLKLLAHGDAIKAFIKENQSKLSSK